MRPARPLRGIFFAAALLVSRAAPAETVEPPPAFAVVAADDAEWKSWAQSLAPTKDITADFEEIRRFAFRREPVVLQGTTRISPELGLSLEYREPEQRVVIVDREGVLLREDGRDRAAPSDPRGSAVNRAMLNILRFDLGALLEDFEVKGLRADKNWTLELVPRSAAVSRAVKRIVVEGLGPEIGRIVLERSTRQSIEIRVTPRDVMEPFTTDDARRYFRARG